MPEKIAIPIQTIQPPGLLLRGLFFLGKIIHRQDMRKCDYPNDKSKIFILTTKDTKRTKKYKHIVYFQLRALRVLRGYLTVSRQQFRWHSHLTLTGSKGPETSVHLAPILGKIRDKVPKISVAARIANRHTTSRLYKQLSVLKQEIK